MSVEDLIPAAAQALAHLRERSPRVHVITNSVVQGFTANVMLAAGVTPSMTTSAGEIADFAATADALLVNLGTLDKGRESAIDGAVELVLDTGKPWVLDPVFIHVSPLRRDYAATLARRDPAVLRGNAQELAALRSVLQTSDTRQDMQDSNAAALSLATLAIAVQTGERDQVSDGARHAVLGNGHPHLAQVTGTGCAGGALTAAFLAVESDRFVAAAASLFLLGIAAENAAIASDGPGSFAWRLIDAIHQVSPADIARRAAVLDMRA